MDTDPNEIFKSVGIACHEWEIFESQLATIYSVFICRPNQTDALEEYGSMATVFSKRIILLKKAAEAFNVKLQNQEIEGELHAILGMGDMLSDFRHQIAHGIVQMIPTIGTMDKEGNVTTHPTPYYFLMAPWFSQPRLRTDGKAYRYTSIDIANHADTFRQAASRASLYAQRLQAEASC